MQHQVSLFPCLLFSPYQDDIATDYTKHLWKERGPAEHLFIWSVNELDSLRKQRYVLFFRVKVHGSSPVALAMAQ